MSLELKKGSRSDSDCCSSNSHLLDYANRIGSFVATNGKIGTARQLFFVNHLLRKNMNLEI